MRRSLTHFWQIHLAVVLGAAVATSVLSGALLVGDSVRGSLRNLSLERLGRIDDILVSTRFFRSELATDLSGESAFGKHAVPAIFLGGSAVNASTRSRASRVQIQGIDHRFAALFKPGPGTEQPGLFLPGKQNQVFPPVIINQSLQKELNAHVGDPILLSFERPSDIHREFLFGREGASQTVQTLRLTLTHVIPDRGMGRFGLWSHQSLPLNAFVSLPVLQKTLGQRGRVNAILVSRRDENTRPQDLQAALSRVLHLDDIGLVFYEQPDYFSIESTQFILKPDIVKTIKTLASTHRTPFLPVLTYLANTISAGDREIPYSTVTALNYGAAEKNTASAPFGTFKLTDGSPVPQLGEDEILLNAWAANDLSVRVEDRIELTYFLVGPREQLFTRRASFRLKGTVALEGMAADPKLTPEFPGIQDADNMSAWKAPFPVDLNRIRSRDEAYWDTFGAAPKAFVSEETGQRLWRSRFGTISAVRIGASPGLDVSTTLANFQADLLRKIRPEQVGLEFQPVKARGLSAASGATDFSVLFIGFSQFLIVSAALLVGLLFRLGVEQRAKEVGILLASGHPLAAIRRRFMSEAAILAGSGGLLGLAGAAFYAWLMIVGLRTWWVSAVGTPFLSLYMTPSSLALGYLISTAVVLFSIWRTVRQLGRVPVRALLEGATTLDRSASGRKPQIYAFASLGLAVALMAAGLAADTTASVGLFFGSGALLLIAGLSFAALWFRREKKEKDAPFGVARIARIGIRNSARHPGRSLLCAALIGCACFVIVAVGANRRAEPSGRTLLEKDAGTGGFALVAQADIPLHHDLNTETGRFELGFSEADAETLNRAQILPFRALPGEDVSCLNLYRPQTPRVLGVPNELIRRGGFRFQQTTEEIGNPWELLEQDLEPGVLPAIGDFNSVVWILHLGLGEDILLYNSAGEEVKLRLVGLLQTSIFQSELLISESNFLKHFSNQSGYRYFLVQTPPENVEQLSAILESRLRNFGYDATSTTQKLAGYQAVENTYLSTFQTLGGLGLVLGTIGLGIILLRNVMERRGELATLRAFGFRRSTLSTMLLAENGFLLLIGLLIGALSALLAVAPHLMAPGVSVPWTSLLLTLALVFLIGILSSAAAAYLAMRIPLLPALKRE